MLLLFDSFPDQDKMRVVEIDLLPVVDMIQVVKRRVQALRSNSSFKAPQFWNQLEDTNTLQLLVKELNNIRQCEGFLYEFASKCM